MSVAGSDQHLTDPSVTAHREVIVVGGGQAGLAIGYFLARQGRDFTILEAAGEPAAAWRERWDSLKLFTPARYDGLPGLEFPGDPERHPGRDEVVAYLSDYARHFDLPVELEQPRPLDQQARGAYLVDLEDRAYEADQVVVATGPFQVPLVPAFAERLDAGVVQLHSSAYRSPRSIPDGPVLVVGGGNTGFQIAEELSASREVHLSIGTRQMPLPQRILGRDLFWYLDATGLIRKTTAVADRAPDVRAGHARGINPPGPTPPRGRAPRAGRGRRGIDRQLRGRHRRRASQHHLGDRIRSRSLVDRCSRVRRERPRHPPARRDGLARALFPRPVLAAHQRLRAAGLGGRRRGVHRATDRCVASAGSPDGVAATASSQERRMSTIRSIPHRRRRPCRGTPTRGGRAGRRRPVRPAHHPGGQASSATPGCGCWPTTARYPGRP